MADQDTFAQMGLLSKMGSLLRGAGLGFKYAQKNFPEYAEHGAYPNLIRRKLEEAYPDLGTRRINFGPLDTAINYAGAYDWAVRPHVEPQDARNMAKAYQLADYMNPSRKDKAAEVADYIDNMAGVEAGILDRAAGNRLSDRDLMAAAYRYAMQRQAERSGQ